MDFFSAPSDPVEDPDGVGGLIRPYMLGNVHSHVAIYTIYEHYYQGVHGDLQNVKFEVWGLKG